MRRPSRGAAPRPCVYDDPGRGGTGDQPGRRRTERGVDTRRPRRAARARPAGCAGSTSRRAPPPARRRGCGGSTRAVTAREPASAPDAADRRSARSRPRSVAMPIRPWSAHPGGDAGVRRPGRRRPRRWSSANPASGCGTRAPAPIRPLTYQSPPATRRRPAPARCRARPTASGGAVGAAWRGDSRAAAIQAATRLDGSARRLRLDASSTRLAARRRRLDGSSATGSGSTAGDDHDRELSGLVRRAHRRCVRHRAGHLVVGHAAILRHRDPPGSRCRITGVGGRSAVLTG